MNSGSLNKAIIIGHLGHDPELKQLEGGRAMARFNVATSERWRDGNGELQERTDWHRIVVWGKSAEVVGEHLTKGRQVCVEGRIQTRKWQDADGKDKFTTEIVADRVTFLGAKSHRIDADNVAAAAA
jgi:single-strand DNA-binding protein